MAENGSPGENSELTPKQEQFIAALVAGNTIVVASAVVGITERTAYRWFQLPHFNAAYKAVKQFAFDEALEGLRDCTKEAIDTLKLNLKAPEPAVQVRAAHILLTQGMQVHKMEQLETRIQDLEEALKASRV
jgi:hypothetical protein